MSTKVRPRCVCAVFLLLFAVSPVAVLGFSRGAPLGQCDAMRPGHYGADYITANGSEPYIITASTQHYSAGSTITVTVQVKANSPQGTTFAGLMLQARNTTGARVGNFSVSGQKLQPLACGGVADTAVTHTSELQTATSITATWTAPTDELAGNVTFIATVVQRLLVIYEKLGLVLTFVDPGDVSDSTTDVGSGGGDYDNDSSDGGTTQSGDHTGGAESKAPQPLSISVSGSLFLPMFSVVFVWLHGRTQ